MKYTKFIIENYRAIKGPLEIDLSARIIPLIGINECGKTTILQAIYCFDYNNDSTYDGRHLKNTKNLYSLSRNQKSCISAHIEIGSEYVLSVIDQIINELRITENSIPKVAPVSAPTVASAGVYSNVLPNQVVQKSKQQISIELLEQFKENYVDEPLIITRELNGPIFKYLCNFSSLPLNIQNEFCTKIINLLPRIIYTDDFTDRPESLIDIIPSDQQSSDWRNIYSKVFRSVGEHRLEDILHEKDERFQKKILSAVRTYLNETLTGSWSRFSSNNLSIETELSINSSNQLSIKIVERDKDGSESYFDITDRSKGFIWYYNFIMKIMFNPKESGSEKETIFLLDEPGSYLHDKAQMDLCSKLKEISNEEGIVIYCTHSAKLLNPQIIPPNNIKIIEKEDNNIQAISLLDKNDTKSTRNSALQPLYEALEIPEYEMITQNDQIVCVEGIYDKYAIELFCLNLPVNIRIFPSTGAASIISNISYFITFCRPYIALWDNDPEGRKQLKEAKKHFGEFEAENFTELPLMGKDKMRMEDMFEETDLINLRNALALPNAKYESLISTLYFHENEIDKQKIIESLSDKSKENFAALSKMLITTLE